MSALSPAQQALNRWYPASYDDENGPKKDVLYIRINRFAKDAIHMQRHYYFSAQSQAKLQARYDKEKSNSEAELSGYDSKKHEKVSAGRQRIAYDRLFQLEPRKDIREDVIDQTIDPVEVTKGAKDGDEVLERVYQICLKKLADRLL